MSEQLHLVVHLHAKPGEEARLRGVLEGLVAPSRSDPGCLRYELFVDLKDPAHFMLVETWASRALWEAHMATPHLARFGEEGAPLAASWTIAEASRIA